MSLEVCGLCPESLGLPWKTFLRTSILKGNGHIWTQTHANCVQNKSL